MKKLDSYTNPVLLIGFLDGDSNNQAQVRVPDRTRDSVVDALISVVRDLLIRKDNGVCYEKGGKKKPRYKLNKIGLF